MDRYGLISDTRSGALVSEEGAIDWWCPRRFDADPVLTRLLDPAGASVGFTGLAPRRQEYLESTLILRTVLDGVESAFEVIDTLWSSRIVRRVRSLRGPAPVTVTVVPGPARDVAAWSEGVAFDGISVRAGVPFSLSRAGASATVNTEELVVTIDPPGSRETPLSIDAARLLEDRAARHWRSVVGGVDVPGRWSEEAARSALVVHALAGHGAPVLAPVTSLPRVVGGERNTDGRVVAPHVTADWSVVARACGLEEDAAAATDWLIHAVEGEPPLPARLDVDAEEPPSERVLAGMPGWRRSEPVVAGTNLGERRSLVPAAAVIAALAPLEAAPMERLAAHAEWIAAHWEDADASVWALEPRDRRWTSSRLMARRSLDLAAAAARARNPLDLDAARWRDGARAIERWALQLPGPALPSGVPSAVDASLARVVDWGPWPADDEVVRATLAEIIRVLGDGPWVHPYSPDLDDGWEGYEPPSVIATLWVARALARAGRWDEANERMEAAVALAGPLHLLGESVDVATRSSLGNRPSAAAHVALIGAALALAGAPA